MALEGKKLTGDRTLFVDCDDTLVMWDLGKYPSPEFPRVDVTCYGYTTPLVPNRKNIELVIKFAHLGYKIIVWTQSGADWAEAVGKACGLDEHVTLYATKPTWYVDDMPNEFWLPKDRRIWLEPA